ncbi:erythromycin esterase family protein [Streptomyces sp. NPDC057638]|uniref:erythromycin esterase family protein n=1 Tax=Streptomyces sp. NPDC057638 TaxID=3346190 RepID=UPI0036AFF323
MNPLRPKGVWCQTRHTLLLALMLATSLLVVPAPARADDARADPDPVPALSRAARPLADLRPLERMIGDATVVGVGEATHGSAEFFATKDRMFRHLVEREGFRSFSLEANWSAGLRIDAYVVHGEGDIRTIMREEFQESYRLWNTREYLDLFVWMRQYNLRHPHRPVRFMGNDAAYAGPELFDTVTRYVAGYRPALLPEIERLYRASRPLPGASVEETIKGNLVRPLDERKDRAEDVQEALDLLEELPPGPDRERHAWTLQHARAIAQVGTVFSYDYFDAAELGRMMEYRDKTMAENTVWWQRMTGDRVLLSAHNNHVGYETVNPAQYPKVQGAFLREALGERYTSVGFTFGEGAFNAYDLKDPKEPLRVFSVGTPGPDSNEETLKRVSDRPYYLDTRTAPPLARQWLAQARPTWSIGNSWPDDNWKTRLSASYDVLVHLPRITASDLL